MDKRLHRMLKSNNPGVFSSGMRMLFETKTAAEPLAKSEEKRVIYSEAGDSAMDGVMRQGRGSLFGDVVMGPGAVAKVAKEDDEMDDSEKAGRGVASMKDADADGATKVRRTGKSAKVSKAGIFDTWLDGSMHAVREFPIEQMPDRGPRVADVGEDALGREYSDEAFSNLGAGDGSGPAFHGATQDTPNSGFRPMAGRDGAYIGGDEVPYTPGLGDGLRQPYQDRGLGEAGSAPVRVGPNFVMNPGNSGIADPSGFVTPAAKTSVLKDRDPRLGRGLFKDVLLDRRPEDQGNFFGG